jgi:hypothetical protein
MKRFMMTTAIASMAMTGAASAQSLLERVLTDLGTVTPTGIFANTADNVLAGAVPNTSTIGGTQREEARTLQVGDVVTVEIPDSACTGTETVRVQVADANNDGTLEYVALADAPTNTSATAGTNVAGILTDSNVALGGQLFLDTNGALAAFEGTDFTEATRTVTVGSDVFSTSGIDASVTNVLRGLDSATAVTDVASATEAVNALIGNISTTGLGAVNTGDITLSGANLNLTEILDEASAGTSKAVSQDITQVVEQVGTATGETFLALNSALNETNVNASVLNSMSGVNATIGRSGFESNTAFDASSISGLFSAAASSTDSAVAAEIASAIPASIEALTGGISTTALGAVNTGTIVSGAQQDVVGVVSSIVGNASTNVSQ